MSSTFKLPGPTVQARFWAPEDQWRSPGYRPRQAGAADGKGISIGRRRPARSLAPQLQCSGAVSALHELLHLQISRPPLGDTAAPHSHATPAGPHAAGSMRRPCRRPVARCPGGRQLGIGLDVPRRMTMNPAGVVVVVWCLGLNSARPRMMCIGSQAHSCRGLSLPPHPPSPPARPHNGAVP